MNKKVTLYNAMFPLWMLMLFPQMWLLIIPINFLLDSVVILITGKLRKIKNILECYKKSIMKSFLFGFVADAMGAVVMLIPEFTQNGWRQNTVLYEISRAMMLNPFSNIFAFLYVILAIVVSMFFIYNFNLKFVFKKLDIEEKEKKILALAMMFVTAPYTFLVPTVWLY